MKRYDSSMDPPVHDLPPIIFPMDGRMSKDKYIEPASMLFSTCCLVNKLNHSASLIAHTRSRTRVTRPTTLRPILVELLSRAIA